MKCINTFLVLFLFFGCTPDPVEPNPSMEPKLAEPCPMAFGYDEDLEGGVFSYSINDSMHVESKAYFKANRSLSDGLHFHNLYAWGLGIGCYADLTFGIKSSVEFGEFVTNKGNLNIEMYDYCCEDSYYFNIENIWINYEYKVTITEYVDSKASGSFNATYPNAGPTECRPASWIITGAFKDIPVY